MTIVEFLRARLDERHNAALMAAQDAGRHWHEPSSGIVQTEDADQFITGDARVSRFIVDNDPAAVLADVAAKRRILDAFEAIYDDRARLRDAALHLQWNVLRTVVQTLASAHAGHEDYQGAWARDVDR